MLPLGAQLWLADTIAAIAWRALPAMHARVRQNVRHILGSNASPDEVERVAREQWRNYVRYMRDFAALPHSANEEIERIFRAAEGWEHITEAMGRGKGLVIASAHFGNWDLAAGAMAQRHPVHVIADTFNSASMDRLINERRLALGLKVIPIERALKRTISTLRRGESVAFLVDKPVRGDKGVAVNFFGETVRIPAGAAFFAGRVGAPLITAFVWRNPDRSFAAKVFPPIEVDADPRVTMQTIMGLTEQVIREHPDQWYMFRSMWAAPGKRQEARVKTEEPNSPLLEEAVA